MASITFLDTEVDTRSGKVLDIGAVRADRNSFHKNSTAELCGFIKGAEYICGHNILRHDLRFLSNALMDAGLNPAVIDTLYLSPLLFPARPYHALVKDDKLQTDELNNPLNDAIKARDLFYDEVATFHEADQELKAIYYGLLHDQPEFTSFFHYVGFTQRLSSLEQTIREYFQYDICAHAGLTELITIHPVELAYALALIHCRQRDSITPPWVVKNFPEVERIMRMLRSRPCLTGCAYCEQVLDVHKGLKKYFGHDSFRSYGGVPLQESAVQAAVEGRSLLAIFPTGGGKSITFQVPALMSGATTKGLTVVISPLQSLMKDQVDNLEKIGITEAVTINGLLDPIERGKSFERVEDGSATLLYISPESLRSRSIERLMLGRAITRFVIDEAHCFSAWGQDFRVDYLYIGDFIRNLQEQKQLTEPIPVSCFTATAKRKVIEDICAYFRDKLSIELELFTTSASRTNLQYKVLEKNDEAEKYETLRNLIEAKNCPTIIYVSRTTRAFKLAERLTKDGFHARPYHGKMDSREKTANQNAFISGEVPIMVATSAFGMGVDKKDVGMVIHYEISNSLENYIQEAGRAGRDEHISADCYVLFNDEDLSKHFILLNQTKLSIAEIQQVWQAIKDITNFRASVSNSALEIARMAGWDENVNEIETRVTTAIAALEEAGYLKRGQNMPRVFANSIRSRNAQEAIERINGSERFSEKQKVTGIRIIKKLISSRSRKSANDDQGESRIDYLSDHLGVVREEVINIVNLLREENILADAKDLTAFVKRGVNSNTSKKIVDAYGQIENFLLPLFSEEERHMNLKELNEGAEAAGCRESTPGKIRTLINFWVVKNWIRRHSDGYNRDQLVIRYNQPVAILKERLRKRHALAAFIVEYLYKKAQVESKVDGPSEVLVEFSVLELRDAFASHSNLFEVKIEIDDVEDSLFYLSRIEALKIEGGFLVVYNRLTVERLADRNRRYKQEDYRKLAEFYDNKVQQIHIVGEYARKMIDDYKGALQFVDDYFRLNYTAFLSKYFKGGRQQEISRNLTPAKFRQLFGTLSPAQLDIIRDGEKEKKHIAVLAGPGSGKTRVLVHKLASLLLMEDVKHEQLLMLTFSRAAANEFKKRLLALIGNAAHFIEIKTFHAYCFDLLGKVGTLEKSEDIIIRTVGKIRGGEVEPGKITKTVLVIDEAQDMSADEFALISTLMDRNEGMRVIAVGDDDQNIYEFRRSSSQHLASLITGHGAVKHELLRNYRSKSNLVAFTNGLAKKIRHRLKSTPIEAVQPDIGHIRLVRYAGGNLIVPLVQDISTSDLSGTVAVLTRSNDEALQITGSLVKKGIPARLIQSAEGFGLQHLVEVRHLLEVVSTTGDGRVISDEVWKKAKESLRSNFGNSTMAELCNDLIRRFEETSNNLKYRSDLEMFIRESSIEDFLQEHGETIVVSTIHKAKGKEFDHVFVMLENFSPTSDESLRQLYVAFTRARQHLTIHLNGDYLDDINVQGLERAFDMEPYSAPPELSIQLTHRDIWLDFFIPRQEAVSQLVSGDPLLVDESGCTTVSGQQVVRFSKQFNQVVSTHGKNGYRIRRARVNFIVYWKKEDSDQEYRIVLPEVTFERGG